MDTDVASFEDFRACLVDLAKVNRITLAYRPTLAFFDRLLPFARGLGRPLEVVDVGSGYGDMLRGIDQWARRHDIAVSLTGVDLHPWSGMAAAEATILSRAIRWVTADVFGLAETQPIDVVISSHFTHHLPDPQVARFLRWMEANARIGWFVSDLERHPLPYYVFRRFAKLARLHRLVQHDGLVSITRGFTTTDWRGLLTQAEIPLGVVNIEWTVPFRLTLGRIKR